MGVRELFLRRLEPFGGAISSGRHHGLGGAERLVHLSAPFDAREKHLVELDQVIPRAPAAATEEPAAFARLLGAPRLDVSPPGAAGLQVVPTAERACATATPPWPPCPRAPPTMDLQEREKMR